MVSEPLLTPGEEKRALLLARQQPESSGKLQELLEKIRERTVQAVLRFPEVARRLEGVRYRVVGADLREEKPAPGDDRAPRQAEVGLYDYDRDVLVVPIVDLRAGSLVRLEERTGFQPELTPEELEEARTLVLEDPRFEALKGRRGLKADAFPARAGFSPS